jgi:hypothetical protein
MPGENEHYGASVLHPDQIRAGKLALLFRQSSSFREVDQTAAEECAAAIMPGGFFGRLARAPYQVKCSVGFAKQEGLLQLFAVEKTSGGNGMASLVAEFLPDGELRGMVDLVIAPSCRPGLYEVTEARPLAPNPEDAMEEILAEMVADRVLDDLLNRSRPIGAEEWPEHMLFGIVSDL